MCVEGQSVGIAVAVALKVQRLKPTRRAEPRLPSCPEWGPRVASLEHGAGILLSASRWRQGSQWPPDGLKGDLI